jgi:chromosome partitioning protein
MTLHPPPSDGCGDLRRSPTRIIAMLNQKGGVGKTTTAVNLGAAIAQAGRRVCLVDLDPQAHLTLHLGVEAEDIDRTVYDLLVDPECPAEDVLIAAARPNLDAILAEVDLAGAETELVAEPDRQRILRRKLSPIVDRYDFIFIDCPPSLGLLTLNALTLATEIIVPMQAHFLALQGVGRLLETVGLVCRSVNPQLVVSAVVLCMHEAQTTLAKEIVADLDAFFEHARSENVPWRECRVLRPPIRRNIKLAEAPSFGNTIFDYSPWCPGALDYRKLARSLLDGLDEEEATSPEAARGDSGSDAGRIRSEPPPRAFAEVESKPDESTEAVDEVQTEMDSTESACADPVPPANEARQESVPVPAMIVPALSAPADERREDRDEGETD